jgi:hypothetical protein
MSRGSGQGDFSGDTPHPGTFCAHVVEVEITAPCRQLPRIRTRSVRMWVDARGQRSAGGGCNPAIESASAQIRGVDGSFSTRRRRVDQRGPRVPPALGRAPDHRSEFSLNRELEVSELNASSNRQRRLAKLAASGCEIASIGSELTIRRSQSRGLPGAPKSYVGLDNHRTTHQCALTWVIFVQANLDRGFFLRPTFRNMRRTP